MPYITWSLPQQAIADAAGDHAEAHDSTSEGEGQRECDGAHGDAEGEGGGEEEWYDLMLDDDE